MNQSRDDTWAKVVEAFEEIAKLNGPSPTHLKERVINSTHHWSKQDPQRHGVANQHSNETHSHK
jgi:hypothetical protein